MLRTRLTSLVFATACHLRLRAFFVSCITWLACCSFSMLIAAMSSLSCFACSCRALTLAFNCSFDGDGWFVAGVGAKTRLDRPTAVNARLSRAAWRASARVLLVIAVVLEGECPHKHLLLNHCLLMGDVITILNWCNNHRFVPFPPFYREKFGCRLLTYSRFRL